MTSSAPWGERVVAAVVFKGVNNKTLTAGTVKYQVYEEGVTSFSSQGNFAYFHCTQHDGCNVAAPMALTLATPYKVPTNYTGKFEFQMPYKKKTGQMKLLFWGTDQDHEPYDFSATVQFNYTA